MPRQPWKCQNFFLRLPGLIKADEAEIPLSHPKIHPEVPIGQTPRRPASQCQPVSACLTRLRADRIVITLKPGVKWQVSNEQVIAEPAKSLKQVCAIISQEPRG